MGFLPRYDIALKPCTVRKGVCSYNWLHSCALREHEVLLMRDVDDLASHGTQSLGSRDRSSHRPGCPSTKHAGTFCSSTETQTVAKTSNSTMDPPGLKFRPDSVMHVQDSMLLLGPIKPRPACPTRKEERCRRSQCEGTWPEDSYTQ